MRDTGENPQQIQDLIALTNRSNIRVMEIGFNAGHSAETFLKHNDTSLVTSFDLGNHPYVPHAKAYIDHTYPNRHILILGNSLETVPAFVNQYENKFDVIFIDGCHMYEFAKGDIANCFRLAHKDTILILDDTMFTKGWEAGYTVGPTQVWIESIEQKKIYEIERKDYSPGRGMSWGKYNI